MADLKDFELEDDDLDGAAGGCGSDEPVASESGIGGHVIYFTCPNCNAYQSKQPACEIGDLATHQCHWCGHVGMNFNGWGN